jgi:CRISPR-associated protein Csx17
VQAGLDRFQRFSLRETTSANTYEAIYAGSATVTSSGSHNKGIVRIADWVDSLPSDKSLFAGIRAPVERALLRIAQDATPAAWKELLLIIGSTLRRVDQNKNWRKSKVLSALPVDFFERAWPSGSITHEVELARSIASLEPQSYGLRHNIFGFSQAVKPTFETFADPRPASAVWHDGDPVRRLADVLERRLLDAPSPPLKATQPCSVAALNAFTMGDVDAASLTELLPALSLIAWKRPERKTAPEPLPALSTEFLLQGLFRPLLTPRPMCLRTGTDQIVPDATRARTLVKMIRGHMWAPAFSLAERVYRSAGIDVVLPPNEMPVSGDRIAACFLIPLEFSVIRKTFRRWTVQNKKGQLRLPQRF